MISGIGCCALADGFGGVAVILITREVIPVEIFGDGAAENPGGGGGSENGKSATAPFFRWAGTGAR